MEGEFEMDISEVRKIEESDLASVLGMVLAYELHESYVKHGFDFRSDKDVLVAGLLARLKSFFDSVFDVEHGFTTWDDRFHRLVYNVARTVVANKLELRYFTREIPDAFIHSVSGEVAQALYETFQYQIFGRLVEVEDRDDDETDHVIGGVAQDYLFWRGTLS